MPMMAGGAKEMDVRADDGGEVSVASGLARPLKKDDIVGSRAIV